MESNKNDTKELVYKTETNSQISKIKHGYHRGNHEGQRDELEDGNNI